MYNLKNMYDVGLKDYIYYNGDDCVLSYEDFYEFIISLDLKKIDITKVIIHSEYDVEWRYADVVEGGWVRKKELYEGLNNNDRITIVTERSTDSFILKKTISELYPNISDFFTFIDMKENYPFTGV